MNDAGCFAKTALVVRGWWVDPLCPIGHLREAYPKGAPKYNIEIIYADSVSIVVGFAHLRFTSGMLREGRLGEWLLLEGE
jgi:hypothetical protein